MRKTSIRKRLMVSTLLGCLIPFVIGFFVIRNTTEDWLRAASIAHTKSVLRQAAKHVDQAVIDNMKAITELIARDERLIRGAFALTDYTQFPPDQPPSQPSSEEAEISVFFQSIVETNPIIGFVSFGAENGGYVEYPPFSPSASYDPRVRGWYRNSLIHGGTRVSEPYETTVSRELVISIDRPVTRDGDIVGVVSLTIGLDDIMRHVGDIDLAEGGSIYIFSPSGKILLAPEHPEWLMKNATETGTDAFSLMGTRRDSSYEAQLDGVDRIFTVHTSTASGWKYVSVTNRSDILAQSRALSGVLLAVFLLLSIMVGLILYWISGRIARPVAGLSRIITRLARFEFNEADRQEMGGFQRGHDEISEMARELATMQKSYLELRDSLNAMDEQIQNIRVEEHSLRPIVLSSNNPLTSVAHSVNGLLEKVSEYLGRIDFLADHDPLTNLPNRRSFHRRLTESMSNGGTGVVILLDMDNFKSVNDTLGHVFGDSLLQRIAERLSHAAGEHAFVSRFGGDEFLLLYEQQSQEDLDAFVEGLRTLFVEPIELQNLKVRVEFSMGIARYPADSSQYEQIIMYADLAMYDVKKKGKNRHAYFNGDMAAHMRFRQDIKRVLEDALFHDGFCLVYQPQVRLSDGAVIGYEALLRLRDRAFSPAQFIPVAEEDGLIVPIGRAVVRMAVEQLARWRDEGLAPLPVSINFSALQINDSGFLAFTHEMLATHDLTPDALQMEITEHIFMENKIAAIEFLNAMREYGFHIAIDDFGSEYSSLNYLSTLPIDTLKFDRELNLRLLDKYTPEAMGNLVAFVHSLPLFIVAEGIEKEEHVKLLKACGCNAIQGYWFSMPLEPGAISENPPHHYPLP